MTLIYDGTFAFNAKSTHFWCMCTHRVSFIYLFGIICNQSDNACHKLTFIKEKKNNNNTEIGTRSKSLTMCCIAHMYTTNTHNNRQYNNVN